MFTIIESPTNCLIIESWANCEENASGYKNGVKIRSSQNDRTWSIFEIVSTIKLRLNCYLNSNGYMKNNIKINICACSLVVN